MPRRTAQVGRRTSDVALLCTLDDAEWNKTLSAHLRKVILYIAVGGIAAIHESIESGEL